MNMRGVWGILAAAQVPTLMRTSPALGGSTSTVSNTRGFLASQATAAWHEMTWKFKNTGI